MYKLFINDNFIVNVSFFNEFLHKADPLLDDYNEENHVDEIRSGLSIHTNVSDLNEGFELKNLKPYLNEGTISSIRIDDEEGNLAYKTEEYTRVFSSDWLAAHDRGGDFNQPRVYIEFR